MRDFVVTCKRESGREGGREKGGWREGGREGRKRRRETERVETLISFFVPIGPGTFHFTSLNSPF